MRCWRNFCHYLNMVGLGGIQTTIARVSDEHSFVELQPNGGKWRNRTPEALRLYCFRDSSLDQPDTSCGIPKWDLVAPARIELALSGCKPDALPLHYGAMAPLERFELPTPRFEAWRSNSAELQGHFGGPAGTRTQDPCLQGRRVPCYATGPRSPSTNRLLKCWSARPDSNWRHLVGSQGLGH